MSATKIGNRNCFAKSKLMDDYQNNIRRDYSNDSSSNEYCEKQKSTCGDYQLLRGSSDEEASNDRRPTAAYGQVATLKHEAEKGRNHRPIRDLLSTAGEAANPDAIVLATASAAGASSWCSRDSLRGLRPAATKWVYAEECIRGAARHRPGHLAKSSTSPSAARSNRAGHRP